MSCLGRLKGTSCAQPLKTTQAHLALVGGLQLQLIEYVFSIHHFQETFHRRSYRLIHCWLAASDQSRINVHRQ